MINTTDTAPTAPRLSIRVQGENPLHHLWNNNGTWWIHYTVHPDAFTKARVRRSLRTHDLATAQHRRDEILGALPRAVTAARAA
jgi:hypothetical protein